MCIQRNIETFWIASELGGFFFHFFYRVQNSLGFSYLGAWEGQFNIEPLSCQLATLETVVFYKGMLLNVVVVMA